ncbi:MAG: ATP-binding protein, partial [Bdellovibrionales bacterium]
MKLPFKRKIETQALNRFAASHKSGFLYVRGRRRVGKSWLLHKWCAQRKNALLFTGKKDASKQETIQQFIQAWLAHSLTTNLAELRPELISWDRVFSEIHQHQKSRKKKLILVFDEIQWIAKDTSGFIGSLKNAWVDFEMAGWVSIIVCGSSNKFFSDHVGGEEKILRGLATRSPLWVHPISLLQFKKIVSPHWNNLEVALLYMMIGGIPYYIQQLDLKYGFIQAINSALFSKETIFLDETDELLGLDFNKSGILKVKKILSVLSIWGGTQAKVREKLQLSSSSVSEVFDKLTDFN